MSTFCEQKNQQTSNAVSTSSQPVKHDVFFKYILYLVIVGPGVMKWGRLDLRSNVQIRPHLCRVTFGVSASAATVGFSCCQQLIVHVQKLRSFLVPSGTK